MTEGTEFLNGTEPPSELFDLVGVMGMFTAYTAAQHGSRVVVLERGRLGDPATVHSAAEAGAPPRLEMTPNRNENAGAEPARLRTSVQNQRMIIAIVLIVLAVVFGVVGLIAKALWWLFVIAAILLVIGIVMGVMRRGRSRV